ncbi:LolA family protein [Caldimicrobium thiodismutans]|uniref:LolA family protein n=1 Tax=Caldimicrobium thiodismutans TaxID=1653476 RepID=UPI0009E72D34|nr:outer membrane lipoprotein carrier protein LolA [Caldimicrobium thiodismutans]
MVFVLALLLVLASPFKELKAQSVEEVLEKIQHFYSQTQTLRGSFSQETIFPNGNKENRSGKIWMKKPGLFRWEYNTPEKFIIISDSRNIYVYYPEENQAFVYPSGKALSSQLALGFMSGRGNLRKDLKLESFKVLDEGLWQLNFLPAYQDSQVEKISLRVNLANGEVQELLLHYFSGERVRITFKSLEYNLDIPDRVFKFTPPKNVKIN